MSIVLNHDGVNYWQVGNEIYFAPQGANVDANGSPSGSRFLCYTSSWELYKKAYRIG